MNKKTGNIRKKPVHYSAGHKFRLFVIYWLLIFMLVVLALFGIGRFLPTWAHVLLYISSLVLAGIATWTHVSQGQKGKLDDIAEELR